MLESDRKNILLVALVLGLLMTVAPATASIPGTGPDGNQEQVQETRETLAHTVPATGTAADPLLGGLADPDLVPTDANGLRSGLAGSTPSTGTEADGAVQDTLSPEGDPALDTSAADQAMHDALAKAAGLARTAWSFVPQDDPLKLVNDNVDPLTQTATGVLGSDAYEVQEPAPASGEAALVEPDTVSPQMIAAGAGAAAAAALVAFWLAGSSGSLGAAGGAGASATGGSELRRLLPFASPLFTRFEKDTVLGHPKREALYALILQDPGVSLQSLCDKSGLSRTAVTHHLRLLEMQHLIVSKRMGRSRHYYENGGRFGRDQKDAFAVLHNARTKDVARFVRDHPGAIQKELCTALGIQPSIAHWHLRRLQDAQLVEPVRHGRTVSYFPGVGLKSLDHSAVPQAAPEPAPMPAPLPLAAPSVMRAFPA